MDETGGVLGIMKNIELKLLINDFRKVSPCLRRIGAKHNGRLQQIDIYYNCKNGRLKIRSINNKKFELISYQRPNTNGAKISNYQISNIKPSRFKKVKSDLDNKFGEETTVKKQRILWIYRNTRIHLDKVYGLGKFLELETVVKKINLKQAKKEYNEVAKQLNLSKYKKYNKSYSDLLLSTKRL